MTLRERGVSASDVELRGIHAGLDINGDGGIDFHEMAAAAMSRLLYLSGPQIVDVFAQLDCDQDGRVTYADLRVSSSEANRIVFIIHKRSKMFSSLSRAV